MHLQRLKMVVMITLTGILSCTYKPIQTKKFPIKNIPEHVFKLNQALIRDSIVSIFNIQNQLDNKALNSIFYQDIDGIIMADNFMAETSNDTIFSKEYFTKTKNFDKIFLHNFRQPWPSRYYYSKNEPLKYVADFIISLRQAKNNETHVSISAYKPEVINGVAGIGPHGPSLAARYTSVEPTTIEEYALLLFIANKLGDSSLVALKLPK